MEEPSLSFSQLQEPVHYDWENAGTITYTPTPYSSESQPESSNTEVSQVEEKKNQSEFCSSLNLFQNIQLRTMPTSLKKPRRSLLPRLQRNQKQFQDFVSSHLKTERPVTTKYIVAHTLLKDLQVLEAKSEERFRAKSASGIRGGLKIGQPFLQIDSQAVKPISPKRLTFNDIMNITRGGRSTKSVNLKKKKTRKESCIKERGFKKQPKVLDYNQYLYKKEPSWQIDQVKASKNSKLYGDFTQFRLDSSDSFLQNKDATGKKPDHKARTLKIEVERKIPRVYSSNSLLKDGKSYVPASIYENDLIKRSPSVLFKGAPQIYSRELHYAYVRRLTGQSSELG